MTFVLIKLLWAVWCVQWAKFGFRGKGILKSFNCFICFFQKTTFNKVTEDCYTAQKTYRLILTKYLTALRQANTKDMVIKLADLEEVTG